MLKRRVSIILFHDGEGNVLLQDRREISKHGEEYGFFGGKIEEGETPEQALKREMREELNLEIKKHILFKHSKEIIKKIGREVERFVFLANMPDLTKIIVHEGKLAFTTFEKSFKFKMILGDVELLKEISQHLSHRNQVL